MAEIPSPSLSFYGPFRMGIGTVWTGSVYGDGSTSVGLQLRVDQTNIKSDWQLTVQLEGSIDNVGFQDVGHAIEVFDLERRAVHFDDLHAAWFRVRMTLGADEAPEGAKLLGRIGLTAPRDDDDNTGPPPELPPLDQAMASGTLDMAVPFVFLPPRPTGDDA